MSPQFRAKLRTLTELQRDLVAERAAIYEHDAADCYPSQEAAEAAAWADVVEGGQRSLLGGGR